MKLSVGFCFLLAGTAVLLVQRISGDDGFWLREEVNDVQKRQTWNHFYNKHVFEAPKTEKDGKFWNKIARRRLGNDYGVRPFNTFIRVENAEMILESFRGLKKCKDGFSKSDDEFTIVELTWDKASKKYLVEYPGRFHICVQLNRDHVPIHFHGTA